jgi:transposase
MKFRALLKYFSLDIEARKTSVLTGLNRNTVNRYYDLLRKLIARHCETVLIPINCDGVGLAQDNGRPGEEEIPARGGMYVFGVTCHGGRVRTELVPPEHYAAAQVLLHGKSRSHHCRGLDKYEGLGDLSIGSFCRMRATCADGPSPRPDKTSEQFWTFLKSRLIKFNGISKSTLYLHLKECEFRFNARGEDLYQVLLKMVRGAPLGG